MRRIRDALRLKFGQGLSEQQIAASIGLGKGSVGGYVRWAQRAGLSWPLPDGLDDDSLELLLFSAAPTVPDPDRPIPDWAKVDQELRRPGVTRMLLWEEYRAAHPEGFAYAWFSRISRRGTGVSARRCARRMWEGRRSSSTVLATRST